jgi:hypothetical protein
VLHALGRGAIDAGLRKGRERGKASRAVCVCAGRVVKASATLGGAGVWRGIEAVLRNVNGRNGMRGVGGTTARGRASYDRAAKEPT